MSWLPWMSNSNASGNASINYSIPTGDRYRYRLEARQIVERDQAKDLMAKIANCRTILDVNPTLTMDDLRKLADDKHTCRDDKGEMLQPAKANLARKS